MTNDKFKPTFNNQPFTPQTETRIFLGGRPIDQQTEQISSKRVSKQHYQSARVQEINPGYGPMESSEACKPEAKFKVSTVLTGDYFLGRCGGKIGDISRAGSGKIKDQDFSGIQKRIDEFKSGKLKVYKGDIKSSYERTEECIKFEQFFETSLENVIEELKKKPHYGLSYEYDFTKP